MSEATMTVKVDGELLRIFRATLLRKLEPRLRPTLAQGNVTGFEDDAFVKRFGVALDRVSDKMLLTLALTDAIDRADHAPAGKCGYAFFDE